MGRPLDKTALYDLLTGEGGALNSVWDDAHELAGPQGSQIKSLSIQVFAVFGGHLARVDGASAWDVMQEHFVANRNGNVTRPVEGHMTAVQVATQDAYAMAFSAPGGYGILQFAPVYSPRGRQVCCSLARFAIDHRDVLFIVTVAGNDQHGPSLAGVYQQFSDATMDALRANLVSAGYLAA